MLPHSEINQMIKFSRQNCICRKFVLLFSIGLNAHFLVNYIIKLENCLEAMINPIWPPGHCLLYSLEETGLHPVSSMGFFKKARDMYTLQKQTKGVKKELKQIHVEAEVDSVTVVVTAEQEVISITINEEKWDEFKNVEFGKKRLEETIIKAMNKALKKAQEIASTKMKGIWDQLGVTQK